MAKLYKKIKTELFFIRKLLDPRYTPSCAFKPRCYFDYFKNRFFGGYLLSKLLPYVYQATDDFEIHVLCQKSDLWMLVWSLRSFLYFSRLGPKAIIIHDDGSIDQKSARLLEGKFSNLKVFLRSEADEAILNKSNLSGKILNYRRTGFPLILKLVDTILLSKASKSLIMDSDILFFNRPEEVINYIRPTGGSGDAGYDALLWGMDKKSYDLRIVRSDYLAKHQIVGSDAEFINVSFNIIERGSVTKEMLEEYFNNCIADPKFYFVESCGWICLLGQLRFKLLPVQNYIVKGPIKTDTIGKHFTSARRQELYAYAIDRLKKEIGA